MRKKRLDVRSPSAPTQSQPQVRALQYIRNEEDEKCRRRKSVSPSTGEPEAGGRSPNWCSFLYSHVLGLVLDQTMTQKFLHFDLISKRISLHEITKKKQQADWWVLQRCRFFPVSITKLFLDRSMTRKAIDRRDRVEEEMIEIHKMRESQEQQQQQQQDFMF